ncbi:hypothetical protein [Brevibacillus marinus]|uniref:hypothetical protein n=1 Tax=Brevibacillus marinus TaxID=2496837 RepID=UPI000F82B0DB|nr:hypothetical protein [Brevibacillus marinus]
MNRHNAARSLTEAADPNETRAIQKSRKRKQHKHAVLIISIVLWLSLAAGGYLLADWYIAQTRAYISQQLQEAQHHNAEQLAAVEAEVAKVRDDMSELQEELNYIKENLELTGETLTGTDATKQALEKRMEELTKQLAELKRSLEKLEDAARAW